MDRSIIRRILLLLLFLVFATGAGATTLLPLGSAEYGFLYENLQRLDARSFDRYDFQLGPYQFDRDDFYVGPFESLRDIPTGSLRIFGFAGEDFRTAKESSASSFESLRGGLAAQPNDRLFVYGNFILDEARAKDDTYTGKKWRGLAGDVENAFIHYRTQRWQFMVGRFASFWGMPNSMVLSPRVSLDGFAYSFRWGKLTLSYRLARLDGLNPDKDGTDQFENRYFAGHRLDLQLSRRLRVGFFETVVFGGPGRQVDLYYLNPLIFFHASQLNEGTNDNSFIGFDFAFKPRLGLKLYGQIVIDDFQIDSRDQSDQEPNEIAYILGGHWVDLTPSVDLKIEYSRVTNRTFNQMYPRNRYLYRGELLGGALGNDYDQWQVGVNRWFGNELKASLLFERCRQGQGAVTDEWTMPWLEVDGDYHEAFPTGVVESCNRLAVGFTGFIKNNFFVDIETGIDWLSNYRHIDGERTSLPYARIRLSTFMFSTIGIE